MSGPTNAVSPYKDVPARKDFWPSVPQDPYAVGKNSEGGIVSIPPPPPPPPPPDEKPVM